MKLRYLLWAVAALAVVGFAAVMIPSSPVSLQNTVGDPLAPDIPLADVDKPTDPKSYPQRPLREWVTDLSSPDRDVRLKALYAIDRIAPLSERAAPTLAKLMTDDPDQEIRVKASHVLFRVGAGGKPSMPTMIAALETGSPAVRRNCALALMAFKADAKPAVPALIKAMNDPQNDTTIGHTETVQCVAASALGAITAGTAEAVPALTEVVSAARPDKLRAAAARSLGMIGDPAKPAIPALKALLAPANDIDLREDATNALRALGETVPDVGRKKTTDEERRMMGNSQGVKG